ncbi:MAG: metal-dependent hydrolase [Pseudonocardiales bacterium]
MAAPTRRHPADRHDLDHIALHARDVHFEWTDLPLRWIPREAFASHLLNVLHILLPEGERFFVKVFAEALPLIKDVQLREDVLGFIGQEGTHANAHQGVQDYFATQGLDAGGYVREVEYLFRVMLGDRCLPTVRKDEWLIERLGIVAGIEHVTAFLGDWILNSPALDVAAADPRMLDLLRWHGAEEVEHRAVAYDVFMHLDGRYLRRARTYALAAFGLCWLWGRGVRYLMANDPSLVPRQKAHLGDLVRSGRRGLTPTYSDIARCGWRYFQPSYHPAAHASTSQAVAYLAGSPAALAADLPTR